jgi:predicted nucleic acid-binding protein
MDNLCMEFDNLESNYLIVPFLKRFKSYVIFYDRTRKGGPFNISDCLIEVTTWAGLTVLSQGHFIIT